MAIQAFGRILRRLRVLRGMKQAHLAELLGVAQATVSRWERGELPIPPDRIAAAERLLATPPVPSQDAALRRLVETSALKVHLICDRTHRLLAASPARRGEWRGDPADFLGRSLLVYASPAILAAEDGLDALGWHEDRCASLAIDTGSNGDTLLPIRPGRALWERLPLADGSPARLVTTLPP
ncbi:XRE family transcriptional regulator [Azospirillum sp. 412522]|nr:helix-turn-helix transcriptional regulator [Azospirillum sp. 412522]MBY6261280.1 XRE family transcriptional regulator [Azospirillum sp. 412522]